MAAAKAQNYLSECLGKPSSLKFLVPKPKPNPPLIWTRSGKFLFQPKLVFNTNPFRLSRVRVSYYLACILVKDLKFQNVFALLFLGWITNFIACGEELSNWSIRFRNDVRISWYVPFLFERKPWVRKFLISNLRNRLSLPQYIRNNFSGSLTRKDIVAL